MPDPSKGGIRALPFVVRMPFRRRNARLDRARANRVYPNVFAAVIVRYAQAIAEQG